MKNKIYAVPLLSALLATLLFISACSQEPIFYDIAQEIELEEATVQGNVYSIVKLNGSLYTANTNIYTKGLNSIRGWSKTSKPDGRVIQLASDSANLYALTAKQTDDDGDEHSYTVWVLLNGTGGWTEIVSSSETIVIFDNAVVGEADNTTGRNAYVRVDEKVYQLNGTTALGTDLVGTNGATTKTLAAAALDRTDYFADTRAFCSNGSNLYKANGTNIQHATTFAGLTNSSVSVNADPSTFTIVAGKLIVGTDDGLQQVTLNNSGVPTGASNLGGNAEATIGESEIFSVASFGDIDDNAIYAGASKRFNSKYNALWGYYDSRDNWNYE